MEILKNASITDVRGIRATGIAAGLKKSGKKDLALIYSETPAVVAAVFTRNLAKAAPIVLDMEHIKNANTRAIIINSGNANSCTGEVGLNDAKTMCASVAAKLGLKVEEVLVQSTGIIGVNLDMPLVESGIENIVNLIKQNGREGDEAARAIMTTDTFIKKVCVRTSIDGKDVMVAGIAKGSGMIHPDMATMLSFVVTDVNIEKKLLQKMFSEIADNTFNMISVDGDTSTNDMACILANAAAGNTKITNESSESYNKFKEAVLYVNKELAKLIAKDGEGATKLIEVVVKNARSLKDAQMVAKSVVTSSLFKAAVFGADPNWGRILCAVGYSKAELIIERVNIYLANDNTKIQVAADGRGIKFDTQKAINILKGEKVDVVIELNDGEFDATAWGCDLSYDYVKINAEYHT
ncbi:bifunctional ornithine acetyltransferase/N-acetylglutamate synthase [Campylobacter sp. faydin G-105]|uniref:bifunctional ornithine acetyltransferase/N-acetylglutamate synthase n=1 Tax=Campylobacter anatolicus TaxID=2829105 RepID=UPI001B984F53|nr:bifunctional ornithine acetyltransferase/N-acetylglutamate synthase [Campylobacter anatolicus]MBR8461788.1 bifunctional ornithine acetyltransferase/N-acetylglutamate synthase [Campylobacter anatolicus]